MCIICGPGSSVGIANDYGMEGPGSYQCVSLAVEGIQTYQTPPTSGKLPGNIIESKVLQGLTLQRGGI